MKIECPHCGARGTDDAPYNVGEPIRRESQKHYAFEVRGNYAGRPVRSSREPSRRWEGLNQQAHNLGGGSAHASLKSPTTLSTSAVSWALQSLPL